MEIVEILKRAKGDAGEGVPWNADPYEVREEIIRRNAKAGYLTKHGEPIHSTKIQNLGYGKSKLNIWPRDENGNLIGD